jgi:hypothetical protein
MRRLLGLAAAGLVLAATSVAAQTGDSPRMAEFRRLCVDTSADFEKVRTLADAAGWQAAPDGAGSKSEELEKSLNRQINDADGMRMLLAGRGDAPGGLTGDFCVLVVPTDAAGLRKEMAAFAGVPASTLLKEEGIDAYAYTIEGGVKKSQSHLDGDQLSALASRQTVYVVMGGGGGRAGIAMFAVLKDQ